MIPPTRGQQIGLVLLLGAVTAYVLWVVLR